MSTPRPHEKWCKSMPREFDAVMGRGPYECDCRAEGVVAPLEPSPQDFYENVFDESMYDEPELAWCDDAKTEAIRRFSFKLAKAYAAAVSKNLQEELAQAHEWGKFKSGVISEAQSQIKELLESDGHEQSCQFRGCTCGRVEKYKLARAKAVESVGEIAALRETKCG